MSDKDLRKAIKEARLYVLLTINLCKLSALDTARLAIRGGADVLQLRGKDVPEKELRRLALELRALTKELGAIFIINDRPNITLEAHADGLHIGQEDMPIEEARRLVGNDKLIGISAHSIQQARQAQANGADYLGIGPIFPTDTKARVNPVETQLIRQVVKEITIPFFAIGGINTNNVRQVLDAGATRIAVCSAIVSQEDVLDAARGLCRELSR
ncbi:MAG TPA: thiamine phosphate synthase [Candidatus Avalokitesvara rifleensis]|uniref:thiamine phosphate synthase n=1 Tax=Candidatus Avalokitesvara rifleensis TaxID=3367620 RepID=UPI002712218E|nr:thiamine phosphate synthase [Candidatus Brocadiales bacterium]